MAGGQSTVSGARQAEMARELAELRDDLNAMAETLAPELLRNGRREGNLWAASCIDDKGGSWSLKLDLKGSHRGRWVDFARSPGQPDYSGDIFSLVVVHKCGGNFRDALEWARRKTGRIDADPATLERRRAERAAEQRQASARDAAEREEKRGKAWWLWRGEGSAPLLATPAESYLAGRGIRFQQLGRFPGSLRYRPDVFCREARDRDGRGNAKLPAMLACIVGLDGVVRGCHRTWLDLSHGKYGPVGKARLDDPKMSLGPYRGGHIPLWKGASRASLKDVPEGTDILVSEGIEDGYSVAMAKPDARIIAGVSLSNIASLELPPQMGDLVILAQNDPIGSKAADALERAIAAHQAQGRRVRASYPPQNFKDWNDWLCGKERT